MPSPASYIPAVSVDIRVFWPPNACPEYVRGVFEAAVNAARLELRPVTP
jgi:hypothetical protein